MIIETWSRLSTALQRLWQACCQEGFIALVLVSLTLVTRHALAHGPWLQPLWDRLAPIASVLDEPAFQRQVVALVLQLGIPVAAIWLLHRRRLRDYGLGIGDHRFWLPVTVVIFAIQVLVIGLHLSRDATYVRRYPSFTPARSGGAAFWAWEGSRALYFFSWEFLFRGYLLFALRRLGYLACAMQMVPFTLMHIVSAKPTSEVYFTIVSGVLSAVLALEGRSVWPIIWLHGAGAILLDVLIVYGRTAS